MFKKIYLFIATFLCAAVINAQVTTSGITGTITGPNNEALNGAVVKAIHEPSGTVYNSIASSSGIINMQGMRPGGPYTIEISFAGLPTKTINNIALTLGDQYVLNEQLGTSTMETVVVTGAGVRQVDKAGASTTVTSRQLSSLPGISRSISDFTRLTPQANGNNFGGRDARYNNITLDGANLNNNFGLSTDPLPGGGANPISLDAIEEISINMAPYDVRQSGFTGANIAAITKSGTNTFRGSLYTYYRDQKMNGTRVGSFKLPPATATKTNIFGGTIGGPIIKNKLFFFVSGEYEKKTLPPGTTYTPKGGSGVGNISNTPVDSLKKLSDWLATKYNYQTGAYDNFKNFQSKNYKFLGKIDWNINSVHKLTGKYSQMVSNNDVLLNAQSVPNSALTGVNSWTSVPRFGANAMSFENSNYGFEDAVRSGSLELNSNKGRWSNQLITTYTKIRDTRTSPSAVFPFIDIIGDPTKTGAASTYAGGARNNYMSVGYEPYSYNNDVKNNIFNITDNFTYNLGKHILTAGLTYEQQYVGNMFMAASQSYYTFGSLADLMNGAHPIAFAYTFSKVPGQSSVYSAALKFGQFGIYGQDEINLSSKLKVIAGLRIDKPMFLENAIENPSITALKFPTKNGGADSTNYNTGQWPKSRFYASPRLGFRYDVHGDKDLIIRGNTGLYLGRIPFVYLTNMPTNSGMYQFGALATAAQLNQITFDPNPTAYQSLFTSPSPTPPTGGFVLVNPEWKFLQVWRTNLGFDKKLGQGWTVSTDILYTKDLNAVNYRNANQKDMTGTVTLGPGVTRPSFANTANATRRIYASYANAIVLENNNLGQSFSITPQISKSFSNGLYGSLAYTYTFAQDPTSNPGSQASSTWQNNPTSRTQNDLELAPSAFSVPHRIVANASYRVTYIKHLASTFSFYYEGANQTRYSYIYGSASGTAPAGFANTADINYDGNSQDLMYIPKNATEITFTPLSVTYKDASGTSVTNTYTAQQQSDAFFAFIDKDPYLKKHQGQVAERFGAMTPFFHKLDFRFLQDIFTNVGGRNQTLQFSLDFVNFLNLLNKNWGLRDLYVVNNPLRATKNATTGEVRYQLATYIPNGEVAPKLIDKPFITNYSNSSTWGLQIGLKYIF